MLSRAAERVYWTGRYLERTENTARIIQQYSQLFLDLPPELGAEWLDLVRIFGVMHPFQGSGRESSQAAILQYLMADPESACSLANSVRMARENMRNTRDLLPQESWESANELHSYAKERLALAAAGENQFDVLAECIARCQQINGILIGTMSHNSPHHFLALGQCLERADMTSRIVDVAAAYIQQNEALVQRYRSTLWTNVLKSVSGLQMYLQYCQPQVEGVRAIAFLLHDKDFPRAIRACINEAAESAAQLPNSDEACDAIRQVGRMLEETVLDGTDAELMSTFMDDVQKKLAAVHQAVATTWFL